MKPTMLPSSTQDIRTPSMARSSKATDEKTTCITNDDMFPRAITPRRRPLITAFGIVAICYLTWISFFRSGSPFHLRHLCGIGQNSTSNPHNQHTPHQVPVQIQDPIPAEEELQTTTKALVPLEAHIMSKCPDAQACLQLLILPAMQLISQKINFTLSFLGTPTTNSGVSCMHGPSECMGNILILCASTLYPTPITYLGFTYCLMRSYSDIPDKYLVEDCALEHGIDFKKLNECAVRDDGGYGMGLLTDSVRRSREVGVTKSCTVRLDGEIYCIRDGGEWKDCPNGPGVNDLVIAVEKLYQGS